MRSRPCLSGLLVLLAALVASRSFAAPIALPDDAELVLGIEVGPLLDGPFADKDLPTILDRSLRLASSVDSDILKGSKGLRQLIGLDRPEDRKAFKALIQRVVVVSPFRGKGPGQLWCIEGRFDLANLKKVSDCIVKIDSLRASFEPAVPAAGKLCALKLRQEEFLYFAFVDGSRLYLSNDRDRVEQALKRPEGGPSPLLQQLANPPAHPIWLVGTFQDDDALVSVSSGLSRDADGMNLELVLTARSSEIAARLVEQLKARKGEIESAPAADRWLARVGVELLKRAEVTVNRSEIQMKARFPNADIEKLLP